MEPFDSYPQGGRVPFYQLHGANARHEYGLQLQRCTGSTTCAYCRQNLVDTFHHWLLLARDHVVPEREAIRLGVHGSYYNDVINSVLACAGCNSFDNRYRSSRQPQASWTLEEFLALRDETFQERAGRIALIRAREEAFFAGQPWLTPLG